MFLCCNNKPFSKELSLLTCHIRAVNIELISWRCQHGGVSVELPLYSCHTGTFNIEPYGGVTPRHKLCWSYIEHIMLVVNYTAVIIGLPLNNCHYTAVIINILLQNSFLCRQHKALIILMSLQSCHLPLSVQVCQYRSVTIGLSLLGFHLTDVSIDRDFMYGQIQKIWTRAPDLQTELLTALLTIVIGSFY